MTDFPSPIEPTSEASADIAPAPAPLDVASLESQATPPANVPTSQSSCTPATSPTTSSLIASTILSLSVVLVLLVVLRYLLPATLEQSRYSWHRGQLKAEYEASGEVLKQVSLPNVAGVSQAVARRIVPSVVHVSTSTGETELTGIQAKNLSTGHGSGVIVDPSGLILTNSHVLDEGPVIHILLADERYFTAELLGSDPLTDLAVLKIQANDLLPVEWGNSDEVEIGSPVWAVGSPFGLTGSITFGIVSSKHRLDLTGTQYGEGRNRTKKRGPTPRYSDLMQTDVAVNPGNSGGPLVNARGELIGINTAIIGESYRGVSFAIPSVVAKRVFEEIVKNGTFRRGWLGVYFMSVAEWEKLYGAEYTVDDKGELKREKSGVVVRQVMEGSPAEKAGLQFGDCLTAVGGLTVRNVDEAIFRIGSSEPGSDVVLTILRDNEQLDIKVTIGARPETLEK
jgi:serine protease Do